MAVEGSSGTEYGAVRGADGLDGAQRLLEALDPQQREVALHPEGPMRVLAGAGTGKTRAITYRIAYGVRIGHYDPASIMALTYTVKASGELRNRLAGLGVRGVSARTFHSAALRQLRYFWPNTIGGEVMKIVGHKAALVSHVAGRLGIRFDKAIARDLASEIEWAKAVLITPETYAQSCADHLRIPPAGLTPGRMAELLEAYEEAKWDSRQIDFEDVLLLTIGILRERPDVADTIRRQYRYFVVDEYQDISPLQQELLDEWLGRRANVCVVGDVSQTIYGFSGANSRYLVDFPERYKNSRSVELVRDYRSTPQVVALANEILSASSERSGAVHLVSQMESGPAVEYKIWGDDDAEAQAIVNAIKARLTQGVPASEIAVLYRVNTQAQPFIEALGREGISYVLHGGEAYFNLPEVKEAVLALRRRALEYAQAPLGEAVREVLGPVGWSEKPPKTAGSQRSRWESLEAMITLADTFAAAPGTALPDFVKELDLRIRNQMPPQMGGVTLATLHSAKGLEWDTVYLVGASDGLLPISLAQGSRAIEEERRLLYVGVTRAKTHLTVSYASSRRGETGRAARKPSRFLAHKYRPQTKTTQRVRRREKNAPPLQGQQAKLFEALRTWRSETARAQSRPEFTVLHDSTMELIAINRPADLSALLNTPGIGSMKLQQYGEEILAVVKKH